MTDYDVRELDEGTARPRHWRQIANPGGSTLVGDAIASMTTGDHRRQVNFGMHPDEVTLIYDTVREQGITLATFMRRLVRDHFAASGVDVESRLPALCHMARQSDARHCPLPEHLRPPRSPHKTKRVR